MARFASSLPVVVLGLFVLGQAPLPGAEQEQASDATAFETSLDFETLLHGSDVMPDSLGDGVWTIEPSPGRMLVRVPLTIELADDAAGPQAISGPPIDLRGGRFVAWHIIEPDESVQPGRRGGPPVGFRADSRNIPQELLGGYGQPGTPLRREVDPRLTGAVDAAADGFPTGLPEGTPRFTRKLTLQPDGQIYWKLERFIPGGETSTSANAAGYALKLNPQLLAEQQPERPAAQRNTGGPGGNPRASADARREAEMAYREQITAFRELQKAVRALPDEFTVPMPQPIWAVFEVPNNMSAMTFNGKAPLPWTIGVNDLEALRTLAGRSVGGNALDNESYSAVAAMSGMLRSDHPLTHRLVAKSLSSAGAVSAAEPGDVLYRVLEAIIKGPDAEARNIVLMDLATTIPPTSATIALQRDAFEVMDPAQKIMSLRSQFQVDASDPAKLQEMLAGANAALRDEGLADAGGVLMAVVDAVEPEGDGRGRRPVPGGADDAIPAVVSGINFDGLPETRRDQAIAYVIREAGGRQVPAGWLNHRLIGAGDPALVQRTLELIGEAGSPADVVGPFAERFVAVVFGEPTGEASAVAQLDLEMHHPLPIDSTSHSIYRVLNSGDPATREKAWRALPNFKVADERNPRSGRPTGVSAGDGPDRFALVLDAALSQQPTPRSAARFFAEHDQSPAATEALVMLVVEGDDAAAATAARKLEGSGQPIGVALLEIEPSRRGAFGNRVYAALSPDPTWVGGLLRDPNDRAQLNRWFGEQLAVGELPTEAQWAEQFRNEDDLFQLASGQDVDLSRGAVAALVGSAGGDRRAAEELAATFGAASDRSASGLKTLWIDAKKDIYGRRLADTAGQYRLIVDIGPADTDADAPPFGQRPEAFGFDPRGGIPGYVAGGTQPIPSGPTDAQTEANDPNKTVKVTLGVVDLIADGQSVRFGGDPFDLTVPDDYLAIRIDRVAKLKNFEDPDLADIDLEAVSEPLDLRVQPDDTWEGEVRLRDGRVLRLTLEPIESE